MMVRMQIQFTEEQAAALKRSAERRGTSASAVAREAVDRFFREDGDVSPEESTERILEMMGKFHSGFTDVAENHDEHLAQIIESKFP